MTADAAVCEAPASAQISGVWIRKLPVRVSPCILTTIRGVDLCKNVAGSKLHSLLIIPRV